MPRRSSEDVNVVRLPGRGRPEPPAKLTQAESRAWRTIVDSSPDGFIDGAGQLLLKRIVAQIAVAERHEERLRRIAEAGGDLEDELEVSRAHCDVAKSIIVGLTALRATPRARMESRNARDAYARAPSGRRPWDIEARATETSTPTSEVKNGDEIA
jgi:hypothetical protein